MRKLLGILVSADSALADAVRPVIGNVSNLHLEVLDALEAPYPQLFRADLGLLILHLGRRKSDCDDLMRILDMVALLRRRIAVIVISDQPNPELALTLTKAGTAEYLERPLNLHRLSYLADTLTIPVRHKASDAAVPQGAGIAALGETDPFLFTPDTETARMIQKVLQVAPQDTTLLLTGETGTGKSRLTRLIHELSPRRDKPFLVVNCGALSANLIESELFGHLKGAFTGADRDRTGKCADVGRGTLVLDEIDSLTLAMQAKLLRVVEDRVYERVGCNRSMNLEARLIVASNRDLPQEIASGRFRSDLYYRLNVVEFRMLALRQRPAVVRPLAEYFLSLYAAKYGRAISGFNAEALEAIQEFQWPGNVRELRNVVERAVALSTNAHIDLDDLPLHVHQAPEAVPEELEDVLEPALASDDPARTIPVPSRRTTLAGTKEEAEVVRITQVLAKNANNRRRAAMELGISRMTLYNKLHRYGLIKAS